MKVLIPAAIALTIGIAAPLRQAAEPVDAAAIAKIRDEGLNRSQAGAMFSMFATTIGPRLTGSPAHKRAADWAKERLTAMGLANARLEPFEFGRGWVMDRFFVEMIEPRYMPLLGYPEAWTANTPGEIVAPVAFVPGKSATDLAAMGAQLKGAAVFQSALVTN